MIVTSKEYRAERTTTGELLVVIFIIFKRKLFPFVKVSSILIEGDVEYE